MKLNVFKGVSGVSLVAILLASPALGQAAEVDFGDDSSMWANDGECDDPRFIGTGMTETELLEADRMRDASDCRAAYEAGTITLRGAQTAAVTPPASSPPVPQGAPSQQDGGTTEVADIAAPAPGPAEASEPGSPAAEPAAPETVEPATPAAPVPAAAEPVAPPIETAAPTTDTAAVPPPALETDPIDFGDDSSTWANDGECDDPRFAGGGMASELLDEDIARDASDCRALYTAGQITYNADYVPLLERARAMTPDGFDFGNDASRWAGDGECDDPRFTGEGANAKQVQVDLGRDASDCIAAFVAGRVTFVDGAAAWVVPLHPDAGAIDFGDDSSTWANDGECDDPRFAGAAMAAKLDPKDSGHDASDCRAAYMDERIYLK